MLLDGGHGQAQRLFDGRVGLALGHCPQHVEFSGRERGQCGPGRVGAPGDEGVDDQRVDHRTAACHLTQRSDQIFQVVEPVLEEVGQTGGAVTQQGEGRVDRPV